jgi:putative endonuclease
MERGGFVYIMASQPRGTLYIGVTSDLMKRVSQHRQGLLPGFTKRYGCKHLMWFEQFGDIELAIAREKATKEWRRDWKIRLIESTNPDWHDLAIGLGFGPTSARLVSKGRSAEPFLPVPRCQISGVSQRLGLIMVHPRHPQARPRKTPWIP